LNISFDFHDVIVTIWRWAAGVSIGSVIALAIAILTGQFPVALAWVRGFAGFLRCLPILALVPLVAKVLGIGEHAKILLIAWACFFPVFLSTVGSIGQKIPDLELRIAVRNLPRGQVWLRYELPRMLKGFVSGVETAIGIGWLTVVAAETLGTLSYGPFRGGLGSAVFVAFANSDYKLGLTCLAVFGVLGFFTSLLWRPLARGVVRILGFDRAMLEAQ
jgi:sulfonate transport system permease protein